MATRAAQGPLLRSGEPEGQEVHTIELFFDLVYVFVITQLALRLIEHLTLRGTLETTILLLAIWQAWIYTTWLTTWFNPEEDLVRGMLVVVMLGSLIVAAAIPMAFEERGTTFALVYVLLSIGRTLFAIVHTHEDGGLRRNFQRILVWTSASSVLWLIGAITEDTTRIGLWLVAIGIEYAGPAFGYATPRLGRSTTEDWATIAGGHLAERCQLFILIALGESILTTGRTVAGLSFDLATSAALLAAFLGSVGLWWIYFDKSADDAGKEIQETDDPGRIGRTAYTYLHVPMVAGIIVTAVADELVIAHPTGSPNPSTLAAILGGPALFLLGHTLFRLATVGRISVSRLVALAILGVLALASGSLSPLALTIGTSLAVIMVAVWDRIAHRTSPEGILVPSSAD